MRDGRDRNRRPAFKVPGTPIKLYNAGSPSGSLVTRENGRRRFGPDAHVGSRPDRADRVAERNGFSTGEDARVPQGTRASPLYGARF